MELTELKLQFVIDTTLGSKVYTLLEIMEKGIDLQQVIEDMEVCDCNLNESNSQCQGDCIRFENSEITNVIIV